MFRQAPTPPLWETIQDAGDDSSDGEHSVFENNNGSLSPDKNRQVSGHRQDSQARKRKDDEGRSTRASPVKRPRHGASGRMEVALSRRAMPAKISAQGASRQPPGSSTQAGPSRLVNTTPSVPTVYRSQPSHTTSRPASTLTSRKGLLSNYMPKPGSSNSSNKREGGSAFRKTSDGNSNKKPTEIIEISSDDSEPVARSKPAKGKAFISHKPSTSSVFYSARKSTIGSGGLKPKSKPPPEVITITDSEEERAPQKSVLYSLMKEHLPDGQAEPTTPAPRRTLHSDAMEVVPDALAALTFTPSKETNQDSRSSTIPTSPPQTNTTPSSKVDHPSPSISSPQTSPMKIQVKKPVFNLPGARAIPTPLVNLSPIHRKSFSTQAAVKSVSFLRKRYPSSPENGASDDDNSQGSIDMSKLSDALSVIPTQNMDNVAPSADAPSTQQLIPVLERTSANLAQNIAGTLSLAEALNAVSQANAPKRRVKGAHSRNPSTATKDGNKEMSDLKKAKDSSKAFTSLLSSIKGKEKAVEMSEVTSFPANVMIRASSSPKSDIGEPFAGQIQPSPPPTSASPRLDDARMPDLPSEATSVSEQILEQRPKSAPSGGASTSGHKSIRPSTSVLQSVSIDGLNVAEIEVEKMALPLLSNSPDPITRGASSSAASASDFVHNSDAPVDQQFPIGTTNSSSQMPTLMSLQQPRSTHHSPIQSQDLPSPRQHQLRRSIDSTMMSSIERRPPASNIERRTPREFSSRSAARIISDSMAREFGLPKRERTSTVSDDEAMREVQALFEDDKTNVSMDVDENEEIDNVVVDTTLTTASGESSRRSSRSDASEHWPETPEEDEDLVITQDKESGDTIALPSRKVYGGFQAITMKDYLAEQKGILRRCRFARDLPHNFQDYVNDSPEYLRSMPAMRDVLEAVILENTVQDEPEAPKIEVQNEVDSESTPPWEFYYTNEMWLGEGVPRPDIENLVKCSCKGACNPKSKTCACLKRQREACQDLNLEFAYDKTGKLQIPGYPIFECNNLCGCGDECRNRVVQHGRKVSVAIRKTANKGWGVFATKKIPTGSFIGIYSGELITDVVAHERGIKYNKFGRTYLFDIDFHHLKKDTEDWTNKFTVDAYHAGNFTRFLNHSCDPNSRLFACYINEGNIDKPLLVIFSLRDIEANEEICFNYQGDYPGDDDDDNNTDNSDDDEEYKDRSSPQPQARDLIYMRCMCGAKNCTGVMFK